MSTPEGASVVLTVFAKSVMEAGEEMSRACQWTEADFEEVDG